MTRCNPIHLEDHHKHHDPEPKDTFALIVNLTHDPRQFFLGAKLKYTNKIIIFSNEKNMKESNRE